MYQYICVYNGGWHINTYILYAYRSINFNRKYTIKGRRTHKKITSYQDRRLVVNLFNFARTLCYIYYTKEFIYIQDIMIGFVTTAKKFTCSKKNSYPFFFFCYTEIL